MAKRAKRAGAGFTSPSLTVLVKLGSAIVHAQEFMSPRGHPLDKEEFDARMNDPELAGWMKQMDAAALLPKMRHVPATPAAHQTVKGKRTNKKGAK